MNNSADYHSVLTDPDSNNRGKPAQHFCVLRNHQLKLVAEGRGRQIYAIDMSKRSPGKLTGRKGSAPAISVWRAK